MPFPPSTASEACHRRPSRPVPSPTSITETIVTADQRPPPPRPEGTESPREGPARRHHQTGRYRKRRKVTTADRGPRPRQPPETRIDSLSHALAVSAWLEREYAVFHLPIACLVTTPVIVSVIRPSAPGRTEGDAGPGRVGPRPLLLSQTGFVAQDTPLYRDFTATELVTMGSPNRQPVVDRGCRDLRGRLGGWREIARRAAAGAVRLPGVSRIVSVNLAVPEPNPAKGVGVTGINKRPVDHLVTVRAPGPKTTGLHSGLVGDQIFDIEHHGGDDQAVYAYAREDYDWWQARLSRRLANGLFGENLTTEGVDVNGAVIGERWRIGPRLVLQPTFGRIPCVTFQRKMGEPRWVKTFTRANRPGAYLRVLDPGEVWAGDPVTVQDRPAHGVTIAQAFRAYMTKPELLPELVAIDGLPDDLRKTLAERLLQRR